jgi:hypothetical protein
LCEWLFSPQLKHGRRRGGRTCTFLFLFSAPFGGVSFWSFSCFRIPTLSFILLLFHLFFLILTCSCQYSYNIMSTSNCMSTLYRY